MKDEFEVYGLLKIKASEGMSSSDKMSCVGFFPFLAVRDKAGGRTLQVGDQFALRQDLFSAIRYTALCIVVEVERGTRIGRNLLILAVDTEDMVLKQAAATLYKISIRDTQHASSQR